MNGLERAFAHDLIHRRALDEPLSTAVTSWDGEFTYNELDILSLHLAQQLVSRGIKKGDVIPLLFEKSKWIVIAMVAVLKAGGTFVALDPSQPQDRIRSAIKETSAFIALTSSNCAPAMSNILDELIIVTQDTITGQYGHEQLTAPEWNDAAYIIFTSGSTGKPKGVVIEHEQLLISSLYGGKAMKFGKSTRMLQFSSYAFDACILELITTMIYGGCVCIPSEWERFNDLPGTIARLQVSAAFFTPSLLRTLQRESIDALKIIILGGERIPDDLIATWSKKVDLILAYGPTECTVICFTLNASTEGVKPGSIGRPIPGTGRALIVDPEDYKSPLPSGMVGEIVFEGPVLARGYLNDPVKTKSSFVLLPDRHEGGEEVATRRLYRTGDLGRLDSDGTITFVGRVDNQVKIRGQRLELEEVELHLLKNFPPSLGPSHVVVDLIKPAGTATSPILVAFFVPRDNGESVGHVEWKDESQPVIFTSKSQQKTLAAFMADTTTKLKEFLPSYAIPVVWIPFQRLPMAISGKIDKKQLHAIGERMALSELMKFIRPEYASDSQQSIPSTDMEGVLKTLWAKVLTIPSDTIQLDDNFFWRGGDSVTAIGLSAYARSLNLELTVGNIFQFPRLCDMARVVASSRKISAFEPLNPFSMILNEGAEHSLKRSACQQCRIPIDMVEDIYPCSPTQAALMVTSIKQQGAYVMQFVLPIPRSLDLARLREAWRRVLSMNAILRTRIFQDESGELFQAVIAQDLLWESKDQILSDFLQADKQKCMGLGNVLTRYNVVKDPVNKGASAWFVWTVHHAVLDGWSLLRVFKQVELAYEGQEISSTPPFNNYIKHLTGLDKEKALSFWTSMLDGAPVPDFPEYPTPLYSPFSNRDMNRQVTLKRPLESNITTATLIRTAWILLVGTYSGHTDVLTGVISNGRATAMYNIDELIGPTMTALPFRIKYDRKQSSDELLSRVQQQYLDAIMHEHLGLSDLGRVSPDIKASCNFRTMLVIQATNLQGSTAMFHEAKDMSYYLPYAFALECSMKGDTIDTRAIYDNNVLEENQITRMLAHFGHILQRLCDTTGCEKIADVVEVNENDFSDILGWNSIRPEAICDCVHHFVERQSLMHPESIALVSRESQCDYKTLNDRASMLASFLNQNHGVRVGTIVPLCFEKSTWAVIAMLAVLKAGGAILCLDPNGPIARVEMILQDLGDDCSRCVLTSVVTEAAIAFPHLRNIAIGEEFFSHYTTQASLSHPAVDPGNLAFVVSTSGSTGRPKLVMIEHSAICTSVSLHGKAIGLSQASRVLQFAAYTFDISIGDIFATLFHGGTVCIPSEYDRMNNLAETISELKVNTASLTSTVAGLLNPGQVPSLKTLIQAGEGMTKEIVQRWARNVRLLNFYGPAECTIYCVASEAFTPVANPSTIGRGVGATTWITYPEDCSCLVPIGCVGELLIEGPLLSRGYMNDSAKTHQSFIEQAAWSFLGKDPGADSVRLYKTGDLVRYKSNGELSFVGRADGQLKLRGQRIDIGEVEYHLAQIMPQSSKLAVDGGLTQNGTQILAAFLELRDDVGTDGFSEGLTASGAPSKHFRSLSSRLETELGKNLPPYMVPSIFVPLIKMPLLASGKIDRKRLRARIAELSNEHIRAFRSDFTTADTRLTKKEEMMQRIWNVVLGSQSSFKVDDNFFHSGGDSMLAMKLVATARSSGHRLTVADIFACPQLRDMAKRLQPSHEEIQTPEVPPFSLLSPESKSDLLCQAEAQLRLELQRIDDIYPCLNMQIRFSNPRTRSPTQLVFKLSPEIDHERFYSAWQEVSRVQDIMRTRLMETQQGWFQVKCQTDLRWHWEESLRDYVQNDQDDIMAIGDPLFRFALVKDKSISQDFFVLTVSHAAYDAITLPLLFEDVTRAYTTGKQLPGHNLSFNQFLKLVLPKEEQTVKSYWRSYLSETYSAQLALQLYRIPHSYTPVADTTAIRDFRCVLPESTDISTSTFIEVALGLAIAQVCEAEVVVFAQHRTGRNVPVPGVEGSVIPTMTRSLNKIEARQDTDINILLRSVQSNHIENAVKEHHPWDLIASSSNAAAEACEFAIQLCVTAESNHDLRSLGSDLGIGLAWTGFTSHVPLRFDVSSWPEGRIRIAATFDSNVARTEKIDPLLCAFESTIYQVLNSNGHVTFKDIEPDGGQYDPSSFFMIAEMATASACLSAVQK